MGGYLCILMSKIYMSFGFMVFLAILLITSVVSMFVFKQKIHSLKAELMNLGSVIAMEKKKSIILEANRTLQHSSNYLKNIADSTLNARFTNVKQFVAINDLKYKNKSVAVN